MPALPRRRFLQAGGALGHGAALPAPLRAQQGGAAAKQLIDVWGPSAAIYAAAMVADVEGFARGEGLDVRHVMADGGAKARQIVAAGQATVAMGDIGHVLQISGRGKPAKALMNTEIRAPFANVVVRRDLYESAGIDNVEKLGRWRRPDGAKPIVAATAIGSGTWLFGTYLFEQAGVGDSINWVSGGNAKTMLGGLQSRQLDAIMAFPAWRYDAEAHGWGRTIFDVNDDAAWNRAFGGDIPTTVVYALDTTIKASPDLCQAYVNALHRGMQWLKAHSPAEIYARIGEKYFGDLGAGATTEEFRTAKPIWQYDGTITEASYATGTRLWFREGTDIPQTRYADAIDNRFIDAARHKYGG